jgi:hypothetical protein
MACRGFFYDTPRFDISRHFPFAWTSGGSRGGKRMKVALIFSLLSLALQNTYGETPLLVMRTKANPNYVSGRPKTTVTCEIFSTKAMVTREVQDLEGSSANPLISTEDRPLQITGDIATLIDKSKKGPHSNRNRGQDELPDYIDYTAKSSSGEDIILEQWDARSIYRNLSKAGIRLKTFLDVHCR